MQQRRHWVVVCVVLFVPLIVAESQKSLPTDLDDPVIGTEKGAIHVVTSMECFKSYFVYQSLAMKYTFDKVGQSGNLTRIISCDDEHLITDEDLAIMDTLVVPNWSKHPISGDIYQPYNKPVGLMFWLARHKPTAEWTLILDPDMMFKQPFTLERFQVPEGFAMSAHYNYMEGGHNALAETHIPEVPLRNDHYGGPLKRRADESGAFLFIRTRDLVKVAPLWLTYTEAVRHDPDAWNLTGDAVVKKGKKPWISEMYGYIFATAKVGIRHKIETTVQYYPGYPVRDIPCLIHYGLRHTLDDYVFSKHEHFEFEPLSCPPWNMSTSRKTDQDRGLFPHPPSPTTIKKWEPRLRYGQLMLIEFANTINKALCERHRRKCNESEEAVEKECSIVDKIEEEVEDAYRLLHQPGILCHDDEDRCFFWAQRNECEHTWMYMTEHCRASCQRCREYIPVSNRSTHLPSHHVSSSDRLEGTDLQRCAGMGSAQMLRDAKCRQIVEAGWTLSENPEAPTLRITGNPSIDLQSAMLSKYLTVLVVSCVALCLLVKVIRTRHRRKRNRGHM